MTQPEEPELVRILAADGSLAPNPAAEPYLELVNALADSDLEMLYRDMVVIRAIDRQATNLQRQGQLALWPPSLGQEAAQVGSARAARAVAQRAGCGRGPTARSSACRCARGC